jgi:hypothetical protein
VDSKEEAVYGSEFLPGPEFSIVPAIEVGGFCIENSK